MIVIIKVERQTGETIDKLLQRFKRKVMASNIINEYKERQHFMSKSKKKRNAKNLSKRRKQKVLIEND